MNFEVARTQMLGQQLRAWEVLDDRVLRAFAETPRENFVPARLSRPRVRRRRNPARARPNHARTEGRRPDPASAASRADRRGARRRHRQRLSDGVPRPAREARHERRHLSRISSRPRSRKHRGLRHSQRRARNSPMRSRLSYRARFDAIAVTASVPTLERHFIDMLRPQGRLFIVVGREPAMEAQLITLQPDGTTTTDSLFETVLAPLSQRRAAGALRSLSQRTRALSCREFRS